MTEEERVRWRRERTAFLLRLDHEALKPEHLAPGIEKWVEDCRRDLRAMPEEALPEAVPRLTREFLGHVGTERSFESWERELAG